MSKFEKVSDPERVDSLFCHVPSFEEIEEANQQKFLLDLIREIRNHILGDHK